MTDAGEDSKTQSSSSPRFESIDALRGFDMFWIIGAGSIVMGLRKVSDAEWVKLLADQLEHVPWSGFHFYDLIFPLFVFLVGVSSVFSLQRIVERHGKAAAYWRLIRRAVILYLLGLFYYGGVSRDGDPEMFRYVGVLQRIAICYLFGGIILLNCKLRGMIIALVVILLSYWAMMTFVPVPDVGPGDFAEGKNLANYFDTQYLPGYKWDGDWDPEGLLSNLPAIGSGILGMFAGMILMNPAFTSRQRMTWLIGLGVGCLLVGWLWGFQFPINKKLWTSSFVLFAAGWSYLLVALFHLVIDIAKFDIWARPFVWIGMNSITIYMLTNLISFRSVVLRVVHPPLLSAMGNWAELVVSLLSLSLCVGICYLLYRKQLFLRV
ncbi:MAG: DUF1624 domain-containing protein [Planctomycetaceae bacterium]|nr:DUF1624 domain-containing protein [Planctomycetaceae bacterium]